VTVHQTNTFSLRLAQTRRGKSVLVRRILDTLSLIGRYGTQGFVVSLLVGLALPWLAAVARPLLGVAIFFFVMITFLRVDLRALIRLIRRPGALVLTCICLVLTPAAVVSAAVSVIGRGTLDPGLLLGLAILAAAPPMMSAPAIAMLLKVEPTLILAAVLSITVLSPLVSPIVTNLVAGAAVPLDVVALIQRLVLLIGGAVAAATVLRRLLGQERIHQHKASFDGLGVVMYFIFAVAAMDGVLAAMLTDPGRVVQFLGAAVALSLTGFAVSWLVLRPVAPAERLVLGYATGQRNMGLLIAALGASTPDTTFLFFALAQFPIYIGPQIIRPLADRLRPTAR
jgi:BASS family bile acid:Na+ symporter